MKQSTFAALWAIFFGIGLFGCRQAPPPQTGQVATPPQTEQVAEQPGGHEAMKMSGGEMEDGSVMRTSAKSFEETVASLKQAIEGENLMVIHVIDGQKMMRMAGKQIGPMNQIIFFHPRYMRQVWEANPQAGIQIPLKFIVMERPDQKVVIRYLKPSVLLGKYKGVEAIASELDEVVSRIVEATVSTGS